MRNGGRIKVCIKSVYNLLRSDTYANGMDYEAFLSVHHATTGRRQFELSAILFDLEHPHKRGQIEDAALDLDITLNHCRSRTSHL
jgi:hypothetical protein